MHAEVRGQFVGVDSLLPYEALGVEFTLTSSVEGTYAYSSIFLYSTLITIFLPVSSKPTH